MNTATRPRSCMTLIVIMLFFAGLAPAAAQICAPTNRSCTTLFEHCQRRCDSDKDASACVMRECDGSARQCRETGRWITADKRGCVSTTDRR